MVFRMPFGKFKGCRLPDVETEYLAWVLNNCYRLDAHLREAVERELDRRVGRDEPRQSTALVDFQAVIRTWFREMTMHYHPDRGGSHQAMTALNHAHARLKELAGV